MLLFVIRGIYSLDLLNLYSVNFLNYLFRFQNQHLLASYMSYIFQFLIELVIYPASNFYDCSKMIYFLFSIFNKTTFDFLILFKDIILNKT